MNTNIIGTTTELKCQIYFLELGFNISVPVNVCRYDFIIDTGYELLKIQVKTCNDNRRKDNKKDIISFYTNSSHFINGKSTHTYYNDNEIDYFCTFYNNQCYLIPVDECAKTEQVLRLNPTKNNQSKNTKFAEDYIAKDILDKRISNS